jgi:hypothetical protein
MTVKQLLKGTLTCRRIDQSMQSSAECLVVTQVIGIQLVQEPDRFLPEG